MRIFLIITCLFISTTLKSQKKELVFGELSVEEVEMTSYQKDKEAKAVILYDKGKSIFFDTEKGYDIRFTRHKRIKIFDNSATQHAEVTIPYYVDGYGKTEEIQSIEAITYNVDNGRVIVKQLDPSTIYEERINARWHSKKFVFPDVQNGSILEFRYVLETPFHFNLPDWKFQDRIPTIYSEYEVGMIPFYEYVYLVQGITKFDYQNSALAKEKRIWGSLSKVYGQNVGRGFEFQDNVHTYVLKDIPAFKDESYISSVDDYIIEMDFQLSKFNMPQGGSNDIISTWPELNQSLLKHEKFGKYIKSGSRIAKKLLQEELKLVGSNEVVNSKQIIEYVKNNFEWNGSNSKYASQSVKDLVKKKIGNSADINLFLISLLNEANIAAEPLILSTRSHGKINSTYPFDHFTNYVIVLVKTNSAFLADATENLLPFNKLPIRCLNEKGVVVNKTDEPQWISLTNNSLSLKKGVINISIDSVTMDLKTNVLIQGTDYESFSSRKQFGDDTLKIKKYYSNKIGSVNKVTTLGYDRITMPYTLVFETNHETEKLGKNIVVTPFLNLPLKTNNLVQEKRNYPVDFVHPWEEQMESKIGVPDFLKLTALPEPYELDNDLAQINLVYNFSNGLLTAKGKYRFKKAIYVASEYDQIKQYFDDIVKYFNQAIVFEVNK